MKDCKEIWKDVVGYEGLYQVSTLGNTKSLKKQKWNRFVYITQPEKRLKQRNIKGYYVVRLTKNGKYKNIGVHRLVAQAFIPNPDNLPQVNHKDGNKQNNCVENLEWCTSSYNVKHAFDTGLKTQKKGIENVCSKSVYQYDKNMNLLKVWGSMKEVEREIGVNHSAILRCAKKKQKTAGGYVWRYVI